LIAQQAPALIELGGQHDTLSYRELALVAGDCRP
jgi:hypothetical protein